jgi:hypothetical protein
MALAVRPGDADILAQYQVAEAFIQAVNDFARSSWDSVIEKLEYVNAQQPGYADGTATQTLYDNIAQGSDYIISGEYALASKTTSAQRYWPNSSGIRSLAFEAQIMIAKLKGYRTI